MLSEVGEARKLDSRLYEVAAGWCSPPAPPPPLECAQLLACCSEVGLLAGMCSGWCAAPEDPYGFRGWSGMTSRVTAGWWTPEAAAAAAAAAAAEWWLWWMVWWWEVGEGLMGLGGGGSWSEAVGLMYNPPFIMATASLRENSALDNRSLRLRRVFL